jgi:hypothetical protein
MKKEKYPVDFISEEMIEHAKKQVDFVKVNRTIASGIDTLTGILGEYAFAQYYYGDWKKNNVGRNKGKTDFRNIEIKTSAFPFSEKLNLLVREDYAKKRKPKYYMQIIIDVESSNSNEIRLALKLFYAAGLQVKKLIKHLRKIWVQSLVEKVGTSAIISILKDCIQPRNSKNYIKSNKKPRKQIVFEVSV